MSVNKVSESIISKSEKFDKIDEAKLLSSKISSNVKQLRSKGMIYLAKKNYKKAAKYYSASLQLMEGISGEELGHLRKRCALTLAECELKSGQLYHTIITCSDIIDESPVIDDINSNDNSSSLIGQQPETISTQFNGEYDFLNKVLGKAYYKRGLSLDKLNQTVLAIADYKVAHQLLPKDSKIKYRLDKAVRKYEIFDSNSSFNDTNIFDYIENIVLDNYSKIHLSKSEIRALTQDTTVDSISTRESNSASLSNIFSRSNGADSQQNNGLTGMLGNLGLGGVGNALGGLGGLGSMLGGLGGKGGSMEDTLSFFASMAGVSPDIISKFKEIYKVCFKAFDMYRSIFVSIFKNKESIILGLTVAWVIGTIISTFK